MHDRRILNMAAYVRSAKRRERGGDEDLDRQTKAIFDRAASIGLRVVKLIEEPDDSGVRLHRTGLDELADALADASIDGIIVHDLGRLAREQADFWSLYRKFFAAEGSKRLVSVAERIDTETFPIWVRRLLDGFASVGLVELAEEDTPPEGCLRVMVRKMKFMGVDIAQVYVPHDGSTEEEILLQFDNNAGRPDDLLTIGLSPAEAEDLSDRLASLFED